ncbi:MAG: chemotaxis protein [Hyphomicrobiales bacterium]|nr:chemotaxis protein [Hyphomicrobiales bacterium]
MTAHARKTRPDPHPHGTDEAVDHGSLRDEILSIASDIARMKHEIGRLRPGEIRQSHIPDAGRELDAIVEATEGATHQIMERAEAIMDADASDIEAYKAMVEAQAMGIFEACSFQDITGQRIGKVVETLQLIDRRVSRFIDELETHDLIDRRAEIPVEQETDGERRKRELILHGPQFDGEGIDQDDVDAFFGDGPSQSEIDKLFD